MNDYIIDTKAKAIELKNSIDSLTNDIIARIQQHEFENIDALLTHRHTLVAELIATHTANDEKEDLINYLLTVRERDHSLLQALKEKQDLVKTSVLQLNKVKEYIS